MPETFPADLHARVLAALDTSSGPVRMSNLDAGPALRRIVERHGPKPLPPDEPWPFDCTYCYRSRWPCADWLDAAAAVGVEIEERT